MGGSWTPGPWRLDPEANDEAVIGSRGFLVADCCIFSARKGAPTDAENRANARLIASAPDLAEALEQALWHLGSDADRLQLAIPAGRRTSSLGCVEAIRAALSKARGETA